MITIRDDKVGPDRPVSFHQVLMAADWLHATAGSSKPPSYAPHDSHQFKGRARGPYGSTDPPGPHKSEQAKGQDGPDSKIIPVPLDPTQPHFCLAFSDTFEDRAMALTNSSARVTRYFAADNKEATSIAAFKELQSN
jgi:hypothetical protein